MQDPDQVRISRHRDDSPALSGVRSPKSSIPWRTITLIATPVLLSMINLVEARFEKQRAFQIGDRKYEQLRGVGQEAKRIAIEEGNTVGMQLYTEQVEAAVSRQIQIAPAYQKEADIRQSQGAAEGALPISQANVAKSLFGPLRRIAQIYRDLARIEVERDHGILLRINDGNSDPPEGKYPVTKVEYVGSSPATPARLRELAQEEEKLRKELPALRAALQEGPAALARARTQSIRDCRFPQYEAPR
jgi:hypothetical protein